MFKLEIETGNAAFAEMLVDEVTKILEKVINDLPYKREGICRDSNGNKVGTWKLGDVKMDKVVMSEGERKTLSQILEFDYVRRDIGMATSDEVKDKPMLMSAIKKLSKLIVLAKKIGILEYA